MRFLFVVHKNEEKAEQNSVLFHRLTLKERGLRPNGYFPLMRQPLARFDLNLPSNRFELFWVTKLFSYLVQSLFAYLHCFSAVCATKLPSLS